MQNMICYSFFFLYMRMYITYLFFFPLYYFVLQSLFLLSLLLFFVIFNFYNTGINVVGGDTLNALVAFIDLIVCVFLMEII